MEITREDLLRDGDDEVGSTTEDTPKKPARKQKQNQQQLKKARLDAAYDRAKQIFGKQSFSDSDSEEEAFDEHASVYQETTGMYDCTHTCKLCIL